MTSYAGYGAGYSGQMRPTTPANNGDLERAVRELALEPVLSVIVPPPEALPDTTDNSASWQTAERVFSTNPYSLINQQPLGMMLPRIAQRNAEYAQERMNNPTITDPVVGLYDTTSTEIAVPIAKRTRGKKRDSTDEQPVMTRSRKKKVVDAMDALLQKQGKADDTADFIQRL